MNGKIVYLDSMIRHPTLFFALLLFSAASLPSALAGPTDGTVVGGAGSISQSGANTTINQTSQNMAIDWQSYNVNANERVQYIQPNSSSISLNRILSQNGSTIAGRIDANGQVVLVNPNGIFFTPTSIINVGGIIASGLNIQPNDFMNGNYIFDEVLGTDGIVINSGMINASLGGNVALIGKQVENDGLIVANLGSVTLAAGKQAVLTFDQGGLLGVRVSKDILQNELGVDPAVLNSGEINAAGGRVLLTASTSQDVFSQAVNTGDLNQTVSVVMHEDGSFTLGGGADVVNTGSVDVSTVATTPADQNTGRIVLLGENITSSGELRADAEMGNGGEIELHAQNTTLLTENSVTSARSENEGQGGMIKVLGDNVGLFDQSIVDASGANGGGQVFIGGDQEGNNPLIPNAEFIYLSEDSQVFTDALDNGDGGRLITFASDTARIYGDLFARGGSNGGNGGFIETSGLRGFEISSVPDTSAVSGQGGTWLIDPYSITINNNNTQYVTQSGNEFTSTDTPAELDVSRINVTLNNGSTVIVRTGSDGFEAGDIIFDADLDYDNRENATLTLDALGDIHFMNDSRIRDSNPTNNNSQDALTLNLHARGDVVIGTNVSISTQGGDFVVGDPGNGIIPASFTNNGIITTTGAENRDGGNISIYTSGTLTSTGLSANGGAVTTNTAGRSAGEITLNAGTGITLAGPVTATGGNGVGNDDGNGADITLNGPVTLANDITLDASGVTRGDIIFNNILDGTTARAEGLTLNGNRIQFSGLVGSGTRLGDLIINATGAVDAGTNPLTAGSLVVSQASDFTSGTLDTANAGNTGGDINITADQVTLNDDLDASGTISGSINLTLSAAGSVTLARTTDFTSGITLTGSAGTDTLTAANRANTWTLSATDSTLNGNFSFTGVDTLTGGTAIDTFDITAAYSGNINGGNNNDIFNIEADVSGTINGGQGDDAFNLQSTGITFTGALNGNEGADTFDIQGAGNTFTVAIDGGADSDTLIAADETNYWRVTSTNGGAIYDSDNATQRVAFSTIETITGGTGTDNFLMAASGSIINIDGGTNTNTLTGRNTNNTWTISETENSLATTLNNSPYVNTFTNIATLTGGSQADVFTVNTNSTIDNLQGREGNDTFTIAGTVTSINTGNGPTSTNSVTVNTGGTVTEAITGGDGMDNVTINSGALAGSINTGENTDTVTLASPGVITRTGSPAIEGGNGTDTLTVNTQNNTWAFTSNAQTDGSVINNGTERGFTGFETLNSASGSSDTYDYSRVQGDINVNLADLSDIGTIIGNYGTASAGTSSIIAAQNETANDWQIGEVTINAQATDGRNDGTVFDGTTTLTFENFNALTGGSGNDTFTINAAINSERYQQRCSYG